MFKKQLGLSSAALVAGLLGAAIGVAAPANADEARYYGARYCEGNVASQMRINDVSWVDIYQVGGGTATQDYYIFDQIWRTYTFYSDVKNSSSQNQFTYNQFVSASIFCDN